MVVGIRRDGAHPANNRAIARDADGVVEVGRAAEQAHRDTEASGRAHHEDALADTLPADGGGGADDEIARLAALVALSRFPRGKLETDHQDNCHRCGKHDQRGKFPRGAVLFHYRPTPPLSAEQLAELTYVIVSRADRRNRWLASRPKGPAPIGGHQLLSNGVQTGMAGEGGV